MRSQPERAIQRALVKHLHARCKPEVLWFHVPNGGQRDVRVASQLKAMGTKRGVSDLLFFHNREFFALELKADGGRASPEQMEFQSKFNSTGGYSVIAEGLDEAIRIVEMWGLTKGSGS
jgi:hypothetical protein